MQKPAFSAPSARLVVVCVMTVSVGLPMAIISLSKSLVLIFVVGGLFWLIRSRDPLRPVLATAAPLAIVMALAGMALTVSWSEAPTAVAWGAWAKHAKLLLIPLLLLLIRNKREAVIALVAFAAAQTAVLMGSWLLWAGLPVPWATSDRALTDFAVFSSRLDQPIMSGVTAAICWHLQRFAPGRWGRVTALTVTVMALSNVIFVMNGRTGHLVAVALISLALMWQLPKPYRLFASAIPALVLLAVWLGSATVRDRMTTAVQELTSYARTGTTDSSSGERLNYWRRSVESIMEHPVAGAGVGSWSAEYQRLDQGRGPVATRSVRNPHQEFLLWGVEAGMVGLALLCNILIAAWRDTRRMIAPAARAAQSVLAAMLVACLFNSSLFDATIGDFFCVALALVLAFGWHTRSPSGTTTPEATA
jgi:O-antigen ligase